jgi:hypothetical protein
MIRSSLLLCAILAATAASAADQGAIQVEPANLQGPRPLAKATESAVIRDYLEAWQSLSAAMAENRSDLLNQDFVGVAKDKLTATIDEQAKAGLRTRYRERSHDIQIIFYSPEGLSIQLVDNIEYDVQLLDHEKVQASEPMRARYVAVLTPSEVRWKVRVLQAESQ